MLNLETEDIPTMKPPPVKLEMPAIKRAELKLTPVFNQAVFDSMLFRASPAGISISRSTTGKYVEVNETLAAMLGYARAELLGRTSLELGIWVERADRVRLVALLEQNGKVRDFKARLRRKSGAIAIMQVAAELIEMEGREPKASGSMRSCGAPRTRRMRPTGPKAPFSRTCPMRFGPP